MAVPTIATVDPTSGLTTGGNVVQITGTGFRLPPSPPATGPVGGVAQQTVSVMFEGTRAVWAEAASSTLLLTRVPRWDGAWDILPAALDVRVANLDDAGAEIAGENVTAGDAYTIGRPGLAAESFLQSVSGEVLKIFKRHLLENSFITTSRDFDNNPADLERAIAEAPVIYLMGPTTPVNRLFSANQVDAQEQVGDPLRYERQKPSVTTDVNFDIRVFAQGERHIIGLHQELMHLFDDVPYLTIGDYRYDFRMPFARFPVSVNVPNHSDLYSVRAGCSVIGVHIDRVSGTIVERGWTLEDNDGEPVVEIQSM
jgi:hypothetical protein